MSASATWKRPTLKCLIINLVGMELGHQYCALVLRQYVPLQSLACQKECLAAGLNLIHWLLFEFLLLRQQKISCVRLKVSFDFVRSCDRVYCIHPYDLIRFVNLFDMMQSGHFGDDDGKEQTLASEKPRLTIKRKTAR